MEFSVGGLPSNEVSNVHGHGDADLNFVIPEVVDRLRVQEGPFDPRPGDFAVAGSARFDLGVGDRGALVRASYGMFNTARAVVVVAPRGERRETFLAGELYRTDGYGVQRAASRASALGQYVRQLAGGGTVRLLATVYSARFDSPGVVREDDYERGAQDFFGSYDLRQGGFSSRAALVAPMRVYNLKTTTGPFPVGRIAGVPSRRMHRVSYRIAPATAASVPGNAAADDVALMQTNGYGVFVEGEGSRMGTTVRFRWGFTQTVNFETCSNADNSLGLALRRSSRASISPRCRRPNTAAVTCPGCAPCGISSRPSPRRLGTSMERDIATSGCNSAHSHGLHSDRFDRCDRSGSEGELTHEVR